MSKILTISLNTFREAIRNKVLYSLLFFAVLVIISAMVFGALSVHEEVRLTTDLGLAGMSLFSVIIAIFIGINLLYKELERKTIYSLIPKPIHRYQFVLGKYLGMIMTLAIQILIMTAVLFTIILLQGGTLHEALLKMVILIFFEIVLITAIAVLFSSFSTPLLSGFFTAGMFLLGRSVPDIRMVAHKLPNKSLANLLNIISHIVPNLRLFYATGSESKETYLSVHQTFPDWGYLGVASGYSLLYAVLVLMLAIMFFSRRDFI